jgi:hypothetical protein
VCTFASRQITRFAVEEGFVGWGEESSLGSPTHEAFQRNLEFVVEEADHF